jgi:hypothetical protein
MTTAGPSSPAPSTGLPNCYWAVIDAPGWRRPGALPAHFLAMLDEQIPVPAAGLHAVGVPLGDGRAVVCAVARDRLLQVDRHPFSVELFPSEVPPAIDDAAGRVLSTSRFNLLVGEFEPARFRRARHRRVLRIAAVALVACSLLAIGFERRATHWRAVGSSARLATDRLVSGFDLGGGGEPTLEVVSASVDRLQAVRRAAAQAAPSPDGSLILAELLRGWPASDSSDTQSISIANGVVSVSTTVRGDPRKFLDALRVPDGWILDEPRLNSAGELTRLTLLLRPAPKHPRTPAEVPDAAEGHP